MEDGLQLAPVKTDSQQVHYQRAISTRVQLYGPAYTFHAFFDTGPAIGFTMPDFDATWTAIRRALVCPN